MGTTSKDGVAAVYGTGPKRYDFNENFRDDGKRFDFNVGASAEYNDCELIGYFALSNPPDDECSGKMRGGKHSDGSVPKTYDFGVDCRNGATRLRTEEDHPNGYESVGSGSQGIGMSAKFVGYCFVTKNEASGVRCQIYQDQGNNESTPTNQWKLLLDILESDKNWRQLPSDGQQTIRIDGPGGVSGLKWKWLHIAGIKSTDTPGGATPGGGTPGGGTGGGLSPFKPTPTDANGDGYNDTTGSYVGGTPNTSTGGDTPTPTAPGAPEPIPPEPEIITVTKKITIKWSIRTLPTSCNSAEDTEQTVTEPVFECPPGSNDPITSTMDMHKGAAIKIGLYVAMDKSQCLNDLVKVFTSHIKRVGTAPGEFWWEIWDKNNNLIYITPPDQRVLASNVGLSYADVTIEDFKNEATLNLQDRLVMAYNAEGSDVDNKLVVKYNESENAVDGEKTVLTYYGPNGWVVDPRKDFTCKLLGRNANA